MFSLPLPNQKKITINCVARVKDNIYGEIIAGWINQKVVKLTEVFIIDNLNLVIYSKSYNFVVENLYNFLVLIIIV